MNLSKKKRIDYYLGGLLILLAKPFTLVAGKLLKRDHAETIRGDAVFLKMHGGGSLAIALPALLGLRRRYPHRRFVLIATDSVAVYAEALALFDRIDRINDRSFMALLISSLRALRSNLGCDTIIDLEVYSRLSALFTLATMARNRIGFYLESVFWRTGIYTHLVFFNRFAGSFHFYERLCNLIGGHTASFEQCQEYLRTVLRLPQTHGKNLRRRVAIGQGCSELGRERVLTASQWRRVFSQNMAREGAGDIIFFGTEADGVLAEKTIALLREDYPHVTFVNACGRYTLSDALREIGTCHEFWGIDSGLLHCARLLGLSPLSFWGPTAPATRLKPFPLANERILYAQIPCSPCIHVTESPPCRGDNLCIQSLFNKEIAANAISMVPVFVPLPATNRSCLSRIKKSGPVEPEYE